MLYPLSVLLSLNSLRTRPGDREESGISGEGVAGEMMRPMGQREARISRMYLAASTGRMREGEGARAGKRLHMQGILHDAH